MSSRPGFGCRLRGTDIIPTTLYFARACDSFEVSRVGRKWRKRMPVSNVQFLSVKKILTHPLLKSSLDFVIIRLFVK